MSIKVVPSSSFIFHLFTNHYLKDREFEEEKLSHPLFHFGLPGRMQCKVSAVFVAFYTVEYNCSNNYNDL